MTPKLAKAVAASRAAIDSKRATPYEDQSYCLSSGMEWLSSWSTDDFEGLEASTLLRGETRGIVQLPEGLFEFFTQDGTGFHNPCDAYSKLTTIRDRTMFTRTFDRQYSPRHMKTLAKKWAKELG